jgi:hypothetical protein
VILDLDTQQNYRAGGRVGYAAETAREGLAAMDKGEYVIAAKLLHESAEAYPHPSTLRGLGICLLLDRRPADAVLYLAAAVTLSRPGRRTRPLLLLAKAMLTAGNEPRCAKLLKEGVEIFPYIVGAKIAAALRSRWKKIDLHCLIDELLSLIPKEYETLDAWKDPPVDYGCLIDTYCQRNVDDTDGI